MRTATVTYRRFDGDTGLFSELLTAQLPASWAICSACDGEGKTSAHLGSFSMADLREDPEFAEAYFDGAYDRPCPCCKGAGKTLEIDREACERNPQLREVLACIDAENEAAAANAAMDAAEQRHFYGSCH